MSGSWQRSGSMLQSHSAVYTYICYGKDKGIVRSLRIERYQPDVYRFILKTTVAHAAAINILFNKFWDPKAKPRQKTPTCFSFEVYEASYELNIVRVIEFLKAINERFKVNFFTAEFLEEIRNIVNYDPLKIQHHTISEQKEKENLYANPHRNNSRKLLELLYTTTLDESRLQEIKNSVVFEGENTNQRSKDKNQANPLFYTISKNYGKDKQGRFINVLILNFLLIQKADYTAYLGNPLHDRNDHFQLNAIELIVHLGTFFHKHHDLYLALYNEIMTHIQKPRPFKVFIETEYSSTHLEIETKLKVTVKSKKTAESKQHVFISNLKKPSDESKAELKLRFNDLFKLYYQNFQSPDGYEATREIFSDLIKKTPHLIFETITLPDGTFLGFNFYTKEEVDGRKVFHWVYGVYEKDLQGLFLALFLSIRQPLCMSQIHQLDKKLVGLYCAAISSSGFSVIDVPDMWPYKQPQHVKPLVEKMVKITTFNERQLIQKGIASFYKEFVECRADSIKSPKAKYYFSEVLGLPIDNQQQSIFGNNLAAPMLCFINKLMVDAIQDVLEGVDLKKETEKMLPHYIKCFYGSNTATCNPFVLFSDKREFWKKDNSKTPTISAHHIRSKL